MCKERDTKAATSAAIVAETSASTGNRCILTIGNTNHKLIWMADGSYKKVFEIEGDKNNIFAAFSNNNKKYLEAELKYYSMLSQRGIKIPLIFEQIHEITFMNHSYIGVVMQKMLGEEYKYVSWFRVKKLVNKWWVTDKNSAISKIKNLHDTINTFLISNVNVTDFQIFILNRTGEMVVFDPSSVSYTDGTNQVIATELTKIKKELSKILKNEAKPNQEEKKPE